MKLRPHVEQHTDGKTRDLPISDALADLLEFAAGVAGVDLVWVYSGGQCAEGTCEKRIGSTRHDLGGAADLHLIKDGKALDFSIDTDREYFALFLEACARYGAEGIGAAEDYMGSTAAHIGFGSRNVWGRDGKSANAPDWVRRSVAKGWATRGRTTDLRADRGDEEEMIRRLLETLVDSPDLEKEPPPDEAPAL